jgi:hypothetical protein
LDEEEYNDNFTLLQNIPRKEFKNMNATLKEEGLHPKALVQVNLIDE